MPLGCLRSSADRDLSGLSARAPFLRPGALRVLLHDADGKRSASDRSACDSQRVLEDESGLCARCTQPVTGRDGRVARAGPRERSSAAAAALRATTARRATVRAATARASSDKRPASADGAHGAWPREQQATAALRGLRRAQTSLRNRTNRASAARSSARIFDLAPRGRLNFLERTLVFLRQTARSVGEALVKGHFDHVIRGQVPRCWD